MKKPIALVLLFILVLLTLGCGSGDGTSLVTGPATSKENLPRAPAIPNPE